MIKFLIVRHGNSMANKDGIFAGRTNIPLSDTGLLQAKTTSEYIFKNYHVDKIYSSELDRAYMTVHPLATALGKKIEINSAFNEIYGGLWEGMTFENIAKKYPDLLNTWRNDIGHSVCPEGESFTELIERTYKGLTTLAKSLLDNQTVVIASHAGAIRALQCKIENIDIDKMKDIKWVSNGSVSTVVFEKGQIVDYHFGFDEHLKGIKTELPANI